MSSPSVLAALRGTSKGKLSYKSQLDSDNAGPSMKKFLDELSSPPPISPGAINYINQRTKRLSLDSSTLSENRQRRSNRGHTPLSHTPSPALHTSHPSQVHRHTPSPRHTSQSRGYSLNISDDETDSPGNPPMVSMATNKHSDYLDVDAGESPKVSMTTERSVIDDIHQELEECVESIDDRLLKERAEILSNRREKFSLEMERIKREAEEQLQRTKKVRQRELEQERQRWRAREEQVRIEIEQMLEARKEQIKTKSEVMEAKLRSGEEQKLEILRNIAERRQKALEKLIQQCEQFMEDAKRIEAQFSNMLQSCTHPQFLPAAIKEKVHVSVLTLKDVQRQLAKERQSGQPNQAKVAHCHAQLTGVSPLLAELKTTVDEANLQGERETKKQESLLLEAAKKLEAEKLAKDEEDKKKKEKEKEEKAKTGTASTTGLSISKSMLEVYSSLDDKLSQAETTCSSLTSTTDLALKRYRFDLQKAIAGTINHVSSNSGENLIEKIVTIKRLLGGQSVQVGNKSVNMNGHPDARLYCLNLLAAKIVKQGEDQIASNTQAAFPLSALAVGLWTEFEELGTYFLAHFYTVCPVLVPMYVNRTAGMSETDYMKSQGYKVSKAGVVESQDIYLNRLRGTVRLYAAIIQTLQLPSGPNPPPHPHGLEHGWAWLARMLNIDPHPLITAAALGDFLEIAGHSLMKKYTRQFQKLLFVLWKEYVPKIESITPPSDRGPLARLTQFLEDCISAGQIPEPKGCLSEHFWRTRSHGIAVG